MQPVIAHRHLARREVQTSNTCKNKTCAALQWEHK